MNLGNVRPLIPLNVDPPNHSKYRKLLDPMFAPRRMEEQEEDIPDLAEEEEPGVADGLPQNTSNMEFGKTPGGVDNAVTVNKSLTPPNVPGSTPAAVDEGESLFPDAPARIEKLGHA